ncbi:MAG: 30S ribosomal protein S18 [candidate division TM6 bacterium GW2011_GWE2_41_16]|nr:MAG: 30S ribosomal protein S18 [candidate division TM6 bacterium GW2011_GWE2_41_16]
MAKKAKLKISTRLLRKKARRSSYGSAKRCRFSSGEIPTSAIDYKNVALLKSFITERGKILPARISGTCAQYQRKVAREIKKARAMALLPYASGHAF